jgi:predicted methyltransferase
MRAFAIATALLATAATPVFAQGAPQPAGKASAAIEAAVRDPQRSEANRQRDQYRHPAETLAFFGVKPTDTLVEFSPGGGWYTEILAPLVKGKGRYVALVNARGVEGTQKMLASKQAWFGATTVATIDGATGTSTVPAGSADVVLTFRNVHNLLMGDDPKVAARAFKAFHAMLKPGGTLGVVDHRLPETMDTALEKKSGYIKRSTVMRLAQAAGFRLADESPVNANAKDTHDHPNGVWTLPPSFALKDVDRAKYAAIGESDRFTLKFVKAK